MRWLILAATIASNVGANAFLKAAMRRAAQAPAETVLQPWNNHLLILGVIFSGLTLVFYTLTLKKFELSVAYPVVTSLALVGVFTCSALFFDEQMHWTKLVGAALIIAGVILLSVPRGAAI